jgi:hypothetical protein
VYQEIREIVKDKSVIWDEAGVIKHCDEKEHQRTIFVTESNVTNTKPSRVYGVITAKEMAKYRPATPNIIRG